MVTWGCLSAAMALIWNGASFLVVRFLLGATETGSHSDPKKAH
jgi:hypothetical protein